MPDISMCSRSDCEKRVLCYRYRAEPNERRQAFNKFGYKDGSCDSFIEMKYTDRVLTIQEIDERWKNEKTASCSQTNGTGKC